jgi:hypothetical protein
MQPWSDVLKGIFVNHEQLLMGWLLGILSPAVIEGIRRRRRLKLLERAIALDLQELQYIMALKAFVIRQRAAKLDDDFLLWLEQMLVIYKGKKPAGRYIELMQQLRQIPVSARAKHEPKQGLTLSDGNASLLSIHTNEIALFPVASQVVLHNITGQLEIYNQQVADLRRLFDKTFDDLTPINRTNVQLNLEAGYEYLAQRSIQIANEIKDAPVSLRL